MTSISAAYAKYTYVYSDSFQKIYLPQELKKDNR